MISKPNVALCHDYLTQRGGAERVVLEIARAFPGAPLVTSLYDPSGTFPEFSDIDVRTLALQKIPGLAKHHRYGLPLYAPAFSAATVDAEVVVCSSSGWAHGIRTTGCKLGYLHAPARWLYQKDRYLGGESARGLSSLGATLLGPPLRFWDRQAVDSLDLILCNSTAVAAAIEKHYRRTAVVVPPPPAVVPGGLETPINGLDPGFILCVARLLPYKNVDVVIRAVRQTGRELVVVGRGPDAPRLRACAASSGVRVHFLEGVADDTMRWLYRSCSILVAVSYEDYGLTPLEAGAFGRPVLALRAGGYLDTVQEGITGLFVNGPSDLAVSEGLCSGLDHRWDHQAIVGANARFSAPSFRREIRRWAMELQPRLQ